MPKHIHDNDPTPLATATITAERMIRAPLGIIVSAIVVIISGAIWATMLFRDVQDLKKDMQEVKAILRASYGSQPVITRNNP